MNWIIDRIEEDIAVCEFDKAVTFELPLKYLPKGVKEGDIITLSINKEETENRKEKIEGLMNSLFKD